MKNRAITYTHVSTNGRGAKKRAHKAPHSFDVCVYTTSPESSVVVFSLFCFCFSRAFVVYILPFIATEIVLVVRFFLINQTAKMGTFFEKDKPTATAWETNTKNQQQLPTNEAKRVSHAYTHTHTHMWFCKQQRVVLYYILLAACVCIYICRCKLCVCYVYARL